MNTEYIKLTDLWNDGEYAEVGHIMKEESWNSSEVPSFALFRQILRSKRIKPSSQVPIICKALN